MTLGGLAIAVGLLVDAAIIVVENIVHRLTGAATQAERRERALRGVDRSGRPIAFATLIVIAVFLPLFGMTGIEGRMYQPLAAAVIAAVGASLVLALTLVPSRRRSSCGRRGRQRRGRRAHARGQARVRAAARPAACGTPGSWHSSRCSSPFPALALGASRRQRLHAAARRRRVSAADHPASEASLDEVDRLNHRVEDLLRDIPEVEDVVRRTGRAERTEDPMPHTVSDVLVVLKKERTRASTTIEGDMRERLEHVPGVSRALHDAARHAHR